MFDAQTSALIRAAPAIRTVELETLPQDLTQAYAELVSLRLRQGDPEADAARHLNHERLLRMATIYEALVDARGVDGDCRPAAFVAATAYQILGWASLGDVAPERHLLTASAIHPDITAPLLFLVAEQVPDASEASRRLDGRRADDLVGTAVIETIADLAAERFEAIVERARRLQGLRVTAELSLEEQATQALYGMCWSGIVQLTSNLLDRAVPPLSFRRFDSPELAFVEVERLSLRFIPLPGEGAQIASNYPGPRHLARLLRHVARGLRGAGVAHLPAPAGSNPAVWAQWIRHRARTKPTLWPNHRSAVARGFLDQGHSAVLVLPTGAGKTTLSELKIAASLAAGKKVVFLVPTLALVDQLRDDLAASFPSDIGNVVVSADGDLAILASGPALSQIEVMTPERFLALLSYADADVSELGLIVFDECHLLSPVGGGTRSLDAMLCLLHAIRRAPEADLLFLSAMLTNGEEMAGWLATLTGRPAEFFHDPWKPSRQARGVIIYPQVDLDPLKRYARARERGLNPPRPPLTTTAHALFGLHNNWDPAAPRDTHLLRMVDDPVTLKVGKFGATPNANEVAAVLARCAAATNLKTIVFVQQADHARGTASRLAQNLPVAGRTTPAEDILLAEIRLELGPAATLYVDPTAGALPHNGDMLPAERRLAESLFRRTDGVAVIVATPTLAQGMNLPAQLAILAGNKRHDDAGRAELQQHELLNAAGRAGRAGHLANGTVLLIPEPVVGFEARRRPDASAVAKLRSILPNNDQCVRIDDPLTHLLDQIQAGNLAGSEVRYLMSRLRVGDDEPTAVAAALEMARKSLAAYQASERAEEVAFAAKIDALQAALAEDIQQADPDAVRISAFTGLPSQALQAAAERLARDLDGLPSTVTGWIHWIVDFLRDDEPSRQGLLSRDAEVVTMVTRGRKAGGPTTAAEFENLKAGLQAWCEGKPFDEIEQTLGVPAGSVGFCGRARDLVLKLANRRLYMIAAAVAELARVKLAAVETVSDNPAVLEILAIALRRGLDSPEKAAYAHLHPNIRTRVGVHHEFERRFGERPPVLGFPFRAIIQHVQVMLAFGNVNLPR